MSFTKCCNLRYIGENHSPVSADGYCMSCGYHPKINDLTEQNKILKEAIDDILDDKQFPQSGYYVDMFNDHAREAKRKIEAIEKGE